MVEVYVHKNPNTTKRFLESKKDTFSLWGQIGCVRIYMSIALGTEVSCILATKSLQSKAKRKAIALFRISQDEKSGYPNIGRAWSPSFIQQAGALSLSIKVNPEVEVLDCNIDNVPLCSSFLFSVSLRNDRWGEKDHWNCIRLHQPEILRQVLNV